MKVPLKAFSFITLLLLLFSCTKESFTNSQAALLIASADTLKFDTVFTSTGSVSQFVKIINENDKGIKIQAVRLAGGSASFFKINVDGVPGPQVNDVDVLSGDSIYIYVSVRIDPTAADLPFIIRDSIEISYNGNKKWVQLEAFGQNAHFFRNKIISTNEIWNNDLPYVILDRITIQPGASLTINKGSRIFIHADAPFLVHGSLQVLGGKDLNERVVFAGDRLDLPYRDFPASYPGLIFTQSSNNNLIQYALIKNAYQGIVVVDPSAGIKLKIEQTIIDNAYDAGLLAVNTSIEARNLLVSNCGKNIVIAKGGNYLFEHCTLASYSTGFFQHKEPVLFISNALVQNNMLAAAPLQANFNNCIFWGESGGLVNNEVATVKNESAPFQLQFNHVLWKMTNDPVNSLVTGNNIKNINPGFDSVNTSQRIFDFRLKPGSAAIDKGGPTSLTIDLDGRPRPVNLPDLGAYEVQ